MTGRSIAATPARLIYRINPFFCAMQNSFLQDHIVDGPPILIMAECFHGHFLAKGQLGGELFSALPEHLPLLRTINAIEPDLFGSPIVQD